MERAPLEEALRAAVSPLFAEPHVRAVLAFGSYVAGTMVDGSDVDIVVLHDREGPRDRRYLCHEVRGLRLDLKYWTPEVAAAMLASPTAAAVIAASGGMRVLMDRDGCGAGLAALVAQQAAALAAPVGPVERLSLNACRRTLAGAARRATEAGDTAQAWCLIHASVTGLTEGAYRVAGIPYLDLGKGLRGLRDRFPDLATAVEAALQLPDPEACRLELLALSARVLGDLADEGEDFDTGWIGD